MFGGLLQDSDYSENAQRVPCFSCRKRGEGQCNVKTQDPIYSGYFGDQTSDILIVSFAPTTHRMEFTTEKLRKEDRGYSNAILSENTKNQFDDGGCPKAISEIVKREIGQGKWPYFTALVKCGVFGDSTNAEKIERARNCIDEILLEEIRIIQPRIIICCHVIAYDMLLKSLQNINFKKKAIICFAYSYVNQYSKYSLDEKKATFWPAQMRILDAAKYPRDENDPRIRQDEVCIPC